MATDVVTLSIVEDLEVSKLDFLPNTTNCQRTVSTRFGDTQANRTLVHPNLVQPNDESQGERSNHSTHHTFVVVSDSQIGFIDRNQPQGAYGEVDFNLRAIRAINQMHPKPLFCCMCGDLVDMTSKIYEGQAKSTTSPDKWTQAECDAVQDEQNAVFTELWSELDPSIPLVCLCGNHDVGNRPDATSIQRFQKQFGDDYLAFWANGTYNIVLNSSLIQQPQDAMDLHDAQKGWLEERLQYAVANRARNIFVFTHHPWFLYDENEDETALEGMIDVWLPQWGPKPVDWNGFCESYFPMPRERRVAYLELFAKYKVTACFAGHFHQNVVTTTSFGMQHIISGPLSLVLPSSGNKYQEEPADRGLRIVTVEADQDGGTGTFRHEYISLEDGENDFYRN